MEHTPGILSHVSVGTNDMARALKFYDPVMATIGATRILQFPTPDDPQAVAYGRQFPEFWVHPPHNGEKASVGNGTHLAFLALDAKQVDDFYNAAMAGGATDDGAPGGRELYGPQYYGCFVLDPDGNKIEAMFWDESKAA